LAETTESARKRRGTSITNTINKECVGERV
jgi:hypothetical protein